MPSVPAPADRGLQMGCAGERRADSKRTNKAGRGEGPGPAGLGSLSALGGASCCQKRALGHSGGTGSGEMPAGSLPCGWSWAARGSQKVTGCPFPGPCIAGCSRGRIQSGVTRVNRSPTQGEVKWGSAVEALPFCAARSRFNLDRAARRISYPRPSSSRPHSLGHAPTVPSARKNPVPGASGLDCSAYFPATFELR